MSINALNITNLNMKERLSKKPLMGLWPHALVAGNVTTSTSTSTYNDNIALSQQVLIGTAHNLSQRPDESFVDYYPAHQTTAVCRRGLGRQHRIY